MWRGVVSAWCWLDSERLAFSASRRSFCTALASVLMSLPYLRLISLMKYSITRWSKSSPARQPSEPPHALAPAGRKPRPRLRQQQPYTGRQCGVARAVAGGNVAPTAEVSVAVGGDDLEHAVVDREDGNIERPAAQVEDQDVLLLALHAGSEGLSCRRAGAPARVLVEGGDRLVVVFIYLFGAREAPVPSCRGRRRWRRRSAR